MPQGIVSGLIPHLASAASSIPHLSGRRRVTEQLTFLDAFPHQRSDIAGRFCWRERSHIYGPCTTAFGLSSLARCFSGKR
uniref:Uncharacterized protein n=1 Tax=Ralstonia solanacearum TaxID=305 RepID=A0A0S4W330_RALSL|nr:protein of unknown function [Ralstonia solanacearum]CUV31597.1 protein of unknown function [Ralstonia solanacearum]CUV32556.1 protein of unknown function [Ralstonia solanacearum]CUV41238.1 protein of unknown function [Ralstonia solanacearum]CUV48042.1 protein of unknown function [Ralstonia solanacearum]